MKKKTVIVIIFTTLIVVNLPIINTEIFKRVDGDHFRYSNADASFTDIEVFDILRPWMNEWVVKGFVEDRRPTIQNKEVFRLYKINILCFWRWRYYYAVSKKFKYRSWQQIEPNRVPRVPNNIWQDF